MASITLADVPNHLLGRLRTQAQAGERTVEQELLRILDRWMAGREHSWTPADSEAQFQAWCQLGTWQSDRTAEEEIRDLYARRSGGRIVEL